MSSFDVVAQSAFGVHRLGRSSQFIVARLLRFRTPKTSRSFLTNGHQNLNRSSVAGSTRVCNPALWFVLLQYRESELVTSEDDAYRFSSCCRLKGSTVCDAIVKDRSPVTCWCSSWSAEEAIEYRLIIVRPLHIKDDAPLQDES
ncbi:hypothetical protein HID58_048878 [Brassica napus]|uniref:Uncharacterized protein n=1 Tax=Brassica napus TaxID=3708 RepID=A0ABQ8B3E7_BRANA|nr:hypothetical protein HID58_048878 [Brassica napus]